MKSMDILHGDLLSQCTTIKQRLQTMVATGELDKVHKDSAMQSGKYMSYKWRKYNTVLWTFFRLEAMYDGCNDHVYFVDYSMSLAAPESFVQGVFNILRLIMADNATMDIASINDKYRLRNFCKNEFADKTKAFLERANDLYLNSGNRR